MDIIDFYRLEQKRVHNWMRRSISDLAPEEWNRTIEGIGNNIAFLVWHCVRTEDNILRFILQKRPTIWADLGSAADEAIFRYILLRHPATQEQGLAQPNSPPHPSP